MRSGAIRLGIVDDHPAVRLGLTRAIQADEKTTDARSIPAIVVVESRGTVDELLADTRLVFDVVVLDLSLADGSSPSMNVRKLRNAGCRILIFTGIDDTDKAKQALAAGASGISKKSEEPSYTLEIIRRVAALETIDNQELANAISSDSEFINAKLSAREVETLRLYTLGFPRSLVAEEMNIGLEAVKKNISRIRKKYAAVGRPSRTLIDLQRRALEDGFIQI
jgi:two-component system nitrate/nitrite response regulator NarL